MNEDADNKHKGNPLGFNPGSGEILRRSPALITIMIECHAHPDFKEESPIEKESVKSLEHYGLIQRNGSGSKWWSTRRGRAWIEAFINVPLPDIANQIETKIERREE